MTFRHALLAACALGAASLAAAHHSPAMFDMTTTVVIEGTVKKVVWGNPHTYMEIETVDAAGQPMVQNVEAGPTAVLFTGGMTTASLRAGERVTLRAAPHRRGPGKPGHARSLHEGARRIRPRPRRGEALDVRPADDAGRE